MMRSKRGLAVAVGILSILGAMGPGLAQQVSPAGQPEKPAVERPAPAKSAAKPQRLTGSVKSVSEGSLVLEVMQKDKPAKEYTFSLDPKAKLAKAGKAITTKDLQPGESVTVSFTETGGKLVAKAVTVGVKAAK